MIYPTNLQKEHKTDAIKVDFQSNVLEVVSFDWHGKLLPALNVEGTKEDCLSIVISFGNKNNFEEPKLDNSYGKEQAQAV